MCNWSSSYPIAHTWAHLCLSLLFTLRVHSSLPMLKIEKVQILFGKILMQSNPLCGFWSKKVFFFLFGQIVCSNFNVQSIELNIERKSNLPTVKKTLYYHEAFSQQSYLFKTQSNRWLRSFLSNFSPHL